MRPGDIQDGAILPGTIEDGSTRQPYSLGLCPTCLLFRDGILETTGYILCAKNGIDPDPDTRPYLEGFPRTLQRANLDEYWIRKDAALPMRHCSMYREKAGGRPAGTSPEVSEEDRAEMLAKKHREAAVRYDRRRREQMRTEAEAAGLIDCPQGCGRKVKALTNRLEPTRACPHCRRKTTMRGKTNANGWSSREGS